MRATLHYSGVSCGGVKVTRYTPAARPLSLANSDEGPKESARTVPEETMTINMPPCASQSNVTKSVLLPSRSVALVTLQRPWYPWPLPPYGTVFLTPPLPSHSPLWTLLASAVTKVL